jgi:hypothetical protein
MFIIKQRMIENLSRRDFLKLSSAGLLGLFLAELVLQPARARTGMLGRVAYSKVTSYDLPSNAGLKVNAYLRDTLLDISATLTGGTPGDSNRRWYQVGAAEFVHSGGIQPVENIPNVPVLSLPQGGTVGELTVPFVDSWWGINRRPFRGARLYYATTHWVEGTVTDIVDGKQWYKAYDHLFNAYYYIPVESVHIFSPAEIAPLSPEIPEEEKHIEIWLEQQALMAYEGERLVFTCQVSTGKGEFFTPSGIFTSFHKRPTAHMVGGESDAAMYDLAGVPWDTYLTENGVAIHGTFWHNDYGKPRSHGCINLTPQDARWIYRWTLPVVPAGKRFLYQPGFGTQVHVLQSGAQGTRRAK